MSTAKFLYAFSVALAFGATLAGGAVLTGNPNGFGVALIAFGVVMLIGVIALSGGDQR